MSSPASVSSLGIRKTDNLRFTDKRQLTMSRGLPGVTESTTDLYTDRSARVSGVDLVMEAICRICSKDTHTYVRLATDCDLSMKSREVTYTRQTEINMLSEKSLRECGRRENAGGTKEVPSHCMFGREGMGGVGGVGVLGGEWGVKREAGKKEDWRDRKRNHETMRGSK